MRALTIALAAVCVLIISGCASSSLTIAVVGPNEAPLKGVRVSGMYQTRSSPSDTMPQTGTFDLETDEKGTVCISTSDCLDTMLVTISIKQYTSLHAKIRGFTGMPSKGFEPERIEPPYTDADAINLDQMTIRFRLGVRE